MKNESFHFYIFTAVILNNRTRKRR